MEKTNKPGRIAVLFSEPALLYWVLICTLFIGLSALPFSFAEDLQSFLSVFNGAIFALFLIAFQQKYSSSKKINGHGGNTETGTQEGVETSVSKHIPVIGSLVDLVRADGVLCLVGLLVLTGLAIGLRLLNISALDPVTDENQHMVAAYRLLQGESPDYSRGMLVTYLIALSFKFGSPAEFSDYVGLARMPGAIIGGLTAIPLYFLARHLNKVVALIAAFLWAVSPWSIGVAQYAREYSCYVFLVLLAVLSAIRIDQILLAEKSEIFRRKVVAVLGHVVFILAFCLYAVFIDAKSTLRIGVLLIGIIGFTCLCWRLSELKKIQIPYRKVVIPIAGILLLGAAVYAIYYVGVIGLKYQLETRYAEILILGRKKTPILWWTGFRQVPLIGVLLAASGGIFFLNRRHRTYTIIFVIFSGLLLFYSLFFTRYFRPRYGYYLLPFFTVLISAGIYCFFHYLGSAKSLAIRGIGIVSLVLMLFAVVNYQNTQFSNSGKLKEKNKKNGDVVETGYSLVTNEFHQDLGPLFKFFKNRLREDDIIVTTSATRAGLIIGLGMQEDRILYFNYKAIDRLQWIEAVVGRHKAGWLILDFRRHGMKKKVKHLPLHGTFELSDKTVTMVHRENGLLFYRWDVYRQGIDDLFSGDETIDDGLMQQRTTEFISGI
jgi:hypothetical protein